MISLQNFIQAVEQNVSRVTVYKQPGDGSNGECDCIGLIIGAKRLAGGKWTGKHGSNYAFRNEMQDVAKITSANDLFIGEIVYKAHEPGDSGYDLPEGYKSGKNYNGDLRDYYHVGVVTDISPLEITHCTSPGPIVRDKKLGKWGYGGRLKGVDYGAIETPGTFDKEGGDNMAGVPISTPERVIVAGGNVEAGINMRDMANRNGKIVAVVPQNSYVDLLMKGSEWSKIVYDGKSGYMMTKFIQQDTKTGGSDDSELKSYEQMIADLQAKIADLETRVHNLEFQVGFG